jgi:AraC-like DNA-binding protein
MNNVLIELNENQLIIYESKHREGYALNPHQHEIHQILIAIDGEGEIMINGEWHHFAENHIAVLLPFTSHSVQSDRNLTLFVIAFKAVGEMPHMSEQFFVDHYPSSFIIHPQKEISNELRHIFRKLLFLQSKSDWLSYCEARLQLCELLIKLAKARELNISSKYPAIVNRIKTYIDRHFFEIKSAADIALMHRMSIRYMDNIFKEHIHKTPMQYLTEVRITRAMMLLEGTDNEITSICFEVGYENVSTFYRCFKMLTGHTPYSFRIQKNRDQ